VNLPRAVEDLLRELAPQVLGVLVRRYGDFDAAEDAVQEALLAAATHWAGGGVPEKPLGWLIQTASRRYIDERRSETSRRHREGAAVLSELPAVTVPDRDDSVTVLFMCCHPALSSASAIALTLRAVGGLTTAEIARAFLVPEATMAQRISRAKKQIKSSGIPFDMPAPRLRLVLRVLYLIFNEGYASGGGTLQRADLSDEAIRLARIVHRALPGDAEATGLLALMLLLDARRPARTGGDGELIPLPEQDRARWDRSLIAETRSAPTCWRWPATPTPPRSITGQRQSGRPACRSATTWPRAPRPLWTALWMANLGTRSPGRHLNVRSLLSYPAKAHFASG
jgi:RNA polymerase sigma factor (sigma-70 family)